MNIALIGFRGTGKTTISKLLARKLNKNLISADVEIAKQINQSVERFVKKHSWDKFHDIESDTIEKISNFDDCIFDTNYNIVVRNENIVNLKRSSLVVLLTADIRIVVSRIKNKKYISSFEKSSHLSELRNIFQELEQKYIMAADYILDTSKLSPDEVCDLIMHYVQMEIQ